MRIKNKRNLVAKTLLSTITLAAISATGIYFTREETIARNGRTNALFPTWKYVWDVDNDGEADTTFVKVRIGPVDFKYERRPTKREIKYYNSKQNSR